MKMENIGKTVNIIWQYIQSNRTAMVGKHKYAIAGWKLPCNGVYSFIIQVFRNSS